MQAERLTIPQPRRWFYLFLVFHLTVWTLLPWFFRFSLPIDAIETTIWGHQLQWGYDKNPFLNAWLTALAMHVSGPSSWAMYLMSQLSVVTCFVCVWKLGKKMLSPLEALFAVLLLEGVQYFNVHAIDFDDNTLELGLWGLSTLFLYKAVREKNNIAWLLTGLFAGLGLMTKYYTAILLLMMLLFLCSSSLLRQQFKNPYLYAGFTLLLLLILPHCIWLMSHDYITIHYAYERMTDHPAWTSHLYYPLKFTWDQLAAFSPAVLLALLLYFGRKSNKSLTPSIDPTDRAFLMYLGLGPFLFTVLLSLCTGIHLRAAWGQPLLSLWSIMLLARYRPNITSPHFKKILRIYALLFIALPIAYVISLISAGHTSSANYPAATIAAALTEEWHQRYHQPLKYVAGPRWAAGAVAYYSSDHPAVYIDWQSTVSPWINEAQLRQTGGIFIWDASERQQLAYKDVKKRFTRLKKAHITHFAWHRDHKAQPIELAVAFLPPVATATRHAMLTASSSRPHDDGSV